jgi:hypothetical protein
LDCAFDYVNDDDRLCKVADIFIVLLSVDVHLCSRCFYWLSMGSGELKHDLANGTVYPALW